VENPWRYMATTPSQIDLWRQTPTEHQNLECVRDAARHQHGPRALGGEQLGDAAADAVAGEEKNT
jgi:hypothetical protein